ncbi:MAG TPA: C-terminal binding protein, partial [Dehalococcoidia bacterium]|nr:C-terminal binding protein [Dehalococcoidia bacterium]
LDVLEKEPPDPDDPILKLDNVIFTPHIAYLSVDSIHNLRTMVSEEAGRELLCWAK